MNTFLQLKSTFFKHSFLVSLPFFFIINARNNFYTLIELPDLLSSFFLYFFLILCLYRFYKYIIKTEASCAIICITTVSFILFYGSIYDGLALYIPFLAKHSVLILFFILSLALLMLLLRKRNELSIKKDLSKISLILIILLLYETGRLIYLSITNSETASFATTIDKSNKIKKPDIYVIVFDEYSSSKALKQFYGFDNKKFDSFLIKNNFYVCAESKSNYMRTTFSIASLLNLDYANGLNPTKKTISEDMVLGFKKIKYNKLFPLLEKEGYHPINYSNFDIYKYPSSIKQSFRIFNDRLISSNTLFGRITTDLGWQIKSPWLQNILGTSTSWHMFRDINNRAIISLEKETINSINKPKFVYAHLFMPHPPFLYDSSGHLNNEDLFSISKHYDKKYVPAYIDYLKYTNKKIETIIQNIKQQSSNSAVIFILGDHGYRVNSTELSKNHFFMNLQAVYFPEKDYSALYPHASPINIMRIISNRYLNTQLPLVKDSSILLGETW